MKLRKQTTLKVDSDFFDKIFEKERKKLELQHGIKFSQQKFTRYLYKKGVKFTFPNFKSKMNKKYFPKKIKLKSKL